MNKPVKIFEIAGQDWSKGLSRQTSSTLGGLFTLANNFDPFERNGMCQPGFAPQAISPVSGDVASFLTPFSLSGLGYVFAHAPSKFYRIKTSDNSVTDQTASVTAGAPMGAGIWRSKYVYAVDIGATDEVWAINLDGTGNTKLLAGLVTGVPHIMATGTDAAIAPSLPLSLFVTNGSLIGKIILETGTAGNVANIFTLEVGMVAKDIASDGRYLVIISDNNTPFAVDTKAKCVVTFWDMVKAEADIIYRIDDTALLGMRIVEGTIYIIGYDNIYACSAGTAPQVIYSFTGPNATIGANARPVSPAAVPISAPMLTQKNGVLYWAGADSRIYAYGNPLNPSRKIFYSPYFASTPVTAITATTTRFYAAQTPARIEELAVGTGVRTTANLSVAPIDFGSRYQFAYAKAVLRRAIASGDTFELNVIDNLGGSGSISTTAVRDFSTSPGASTMLFYRTALGGASDVPDFEQINNVVINVGRNALLRFAIYATPLEDQYQG